MAAIKKIRVDRTYSSDNDFEDKGSASLVEKARQLNTSRTINGVGFNGTANISFGTDSVSEGSTNRYFTDARARAAISGSAPVSYNSSTGAISMAAATASANGYMTSTYASKLDGIASGATNVTNTNQLTNGAGYITSSGSISGNAATATTATNLSGGTVSATTGSFSGAVSTGALTVTGGITATGEITAYFSDERLKTDISPISGALDKVMAIGGYTYKANDLAHELGVSRYDNQIGLLAQEVEAVMPELVTQSGLPGYKTIRYDKVVSVLVEAIKEQQAMIEELRKDVKKTLH